MVEFVSCVFRSNGAVKGPASVWEVIKDKYQDDENDELMTNGDLETGEGGGNRHVI